MIVGMLFARDMLKSVPSFLPLTPLLPLLIVQGPGIGSANRRCHSSSGLRGQTWDVVVSPFIVLCPKQLPFPIFSWRFMKMIIKELFVVGWGEYC